MLTVKQIIELLDQNEMLMVECMRDKSVEATKRLFQLGDHRAILKDTLIETLQNQLSQTETK